MEYLENWPKLVKYCGYRYCFLDKIVTLLRYLFFLSFLHFSFYSEDNIPQLEDVNIFLKREYRYFAIYHRWKFIKKIRKSICSFAVFVDRNNRIPASASCRISFTERFSRRIGFPYFSLHSIHPSFFGSFLHSRTVRRIYLCFAWSFLSCFFIMHTFKYMIIFNR